MTTGMRLEPRDEFPHPPEEAANFNESVYVNAFDPLSQVGGWMRLGNRVNEGHAELSVCLYLPGGRVACQFKRPSVERNDAFDAGGLHYEVSEPFSALAMSYDGEVMVLDDPSVLRDPKAMSADAPRAQAAVRFDVRNVSPPHGGEPTAPEHEALMLYGTDFSRGHFNQHVGVRGSIAVGDEHFEIDGFGWRDHSWGPRYWQAIWAYRLFLGNLGEDRGLMLLKNLTPDGPSKRIGVLLVDGAYEEVLDLDVITDWDADYEPTAAKIVVRTPNRSAEIGCRVLTASPLRNRRKIGEETVISRVFEGFTEFTWDGRTGYGMSEYIERLEDGVPVGWPA